MGSPRQDGHRDPFSRRAGSRTKGGVCVVYQARDMRQMLHWRSAQRDPALNRPSGKAKEGSMAWLTIAAPQRAHRLASLSR